MADADAAQIICIVQCFQLSLDLCKVQLINAADDCSCFAALDLVGHDLGVIITLGYRHAGNHKHLSRRNMIVIGYAGKLFDFFGIRIEVHTQLGTDIRYGFARL